MTKFENKETAIEGDDKPFLSYADLVVACSNFIPKDLVREGWSPALQKESFRLEDAFKEAETGATLKIEDADIKLVKKFCSDFPWVMKHRDLVEFDEYVKSL